jgi:hypothetical protein
MLCVLYGCAAVVVVSGRVQWKLCPAVVDRVVSKKVDLTWAADCIAP